MLLKFLTVLLLELHKTVQTYLLLTYLFKEVVAPRIWSLFLFSFLNIIIFTSTSVTSELLARPRG